MRRFPRIVPWIDESEWEWVFHALYFSHDALQQAQGVDRVKAWMSRGKVPHAIESTASLIEISLRDIGHLNSHVSEYELRMQYSMAFIRYLIYSLHIMIF